MTIHWLQQSHVQHFLQLELSNIELAIRCICGPKVLMVGEIYCDALENQLDFPQLLLIKQAMHNTQCYRSYEKHKGSVVFSDLAKLPILSETISSIIAPHALEEAKHPHQLLRELYRVLQPEGHLLLTGFNPYSFIGLQKVCRSKKALMRPYYSHQRVIDWVKVLGFEVSSSGVYSYSPMLKSDRIRQSLEFINRIGDRWFPMLGGGYFLLVKKKELGATMNGLQLKHVKKKKTQLRAIVPAKTSK